MHPCITHINSSISNLNNCHNHHNLSWGGVEITGVEEEEYLAEEEGQWYATIMECRDTMLETSLNLQRLADITNKSTMCSNVCNLSLDGNIERL